MNRNLPSVWFLPLLLAPLSLEAQTSPEAFLGHEVGADRNLVDYHQIRAYFELLDEESDKVSVLNIGQSTLGEPMIMAVITSEDNMANLDRYREIARRLSDPRGLSPEEAERLSQTGKAILLIQTGLHAVEIAHSQHSVEFIYRLAVGDTPFDADQLLDDVIVLLIPAANPDGQLMVVDWYRRNLGTPYEGGPFPRLYHHYAGHDNNRDGIANNLVETRAVSRVLWHDWFPQVYCDHHQAGPGSRIFIPPFVDPADPNIHPLIFSGIDLVGSNMVYDLQKDGLKGVLHGSTYASAWWKGTLTTNAMVHNTIAVFTETASSRIATPIYVDPNEIPEFLTRRSLTFPDPWPGGWWHLRDAVDYILSASMSLVETAAMHKEDLLYNFYKMGRDAVEAHRPGDPFAFVIPSQQTDYPTTLRMLEILQFGGAEIHRATEAFAGDGANFPAGSFVIFVAQPYRPYVLNMLGERDYPAGVPQRLEDNASHALPIADGRRIQPDRRAVRSLVGEAVEHSLPERHGGAVDTVYCPSMPGKMPRMRSLFALLRNKVPMSTARRARHRGGRTFRCRRAVSSSAIRRGFRTLLPELLEEWHAGAHGSGGHGRNRGGCAAHAPHRACISRLRPTATWMKAGPGSYSTISASRSRRCTTRMSEAI